MIIKIRYPLLIKHQPPISLLSDIPNHSYRCLVLSLSRYGTTRSRAKEIISKARADDKMAGKQDKMKPKRSVKDKRGEIPIDLHVCKREKTLGKIESERRTLESSRAGTGVEAPGKPSLSNRKMRSRTIDGCWYADARGWAHNFSFFRPFSE